MSKLVKAEFRNATFLNDLLPSVLWNRFAYKLKVIAKEQDGDKDDTASSIGLDLLKDIHAIMTQNSLLEMGAAQITKALIVLPDSEWRSIQNGRPITSKRINQMLRNYQISSVKRRDSNVYLLTDIENNLRRYLP